MAAPGLGDTKKQGGEGGGHEKLGALYLGTRGAGSMRPTMAAWPRSHHCNCLLKTATKQTCLLRHCLPCTPPVSPAAVAESWHACVAWQNGYVAGAIFIKA